MKPDEPCSQVARFTRYLEDRRHALTLNEAIAADRAGRFQSLPEGSIDFGFTDAVIWLKIPFRNGVDAPLRSVLSFNVTFMHRIEAWLVTEKGSVVRLLQLTEETPFPKRPTGDLRLAAPFTLQPNDVGAIYISYWSAGGTAMPLTIETPTSFAERRAAGDALHAAFYSVTGVLVLFSLLLWGAMRSPLFPLYGLQVGSVLLFLMHGDGATFRYLWPYWPQWNVFASLPLALTMVITAGFFTRAFLDTAGRYPRIDKAFVAVMAVAALTIVAGFAGLEREAKIVAFPIVAIASLIYLVGGLPALKDRLPGSLYYVLGWASISAAASVAFAITTPLLPGSNKLTFDLVRGAMVFDGVMMALALTVRVSKMRAERDDLVKRELATMRANMDLIERIDALEQRHALATAGAEASGRTLALAFRDMRQPLLSLRLAVQRLAREPVAARDAQQLEASLGYLEKLADTLLTADHSSAQAASAGVHDNVGVEEEGPKPRTPEEAEETFKAQLVLDALEQMFARDVRERGLRFTCVNSSATLAARPLVLVRILSNLVTNAVRHARKGGVVVGCRKRDGRKWVCVYDTGPGMSREELKRVMLPGERGASEANDPGGLGLGLSIVAGLAAEHGYLFEARSVPGRGSVFAVGVPVSA